MPLFIDKTRVDRRPSSGLESTFEFLDRVSTPFFQEVREALNRWVGDYPADEQQELISRLRDTSGSFRDAFWELWLYTAYRGAGFNVEIHPEISGSDKRPDFAVSRDGFSAYLEARVATGSSTESVARENLLSGLYKAFNTGDHPDFRLSLSIVQEGTGQPSAKTLRGRVMKWLDSLDVKVVERQGEPLPEHTVAVQGWTFRFTALPLVREKRGTSKAPLISVTPGGSFVGEAGAAFRKALERKGRRYGSAADPLIVAIQIEELWTDNEDVESMLYGRTSQRAERVDGGLVLGAVRRLDDGYWTASKGRRVAAVLTAKDVQPWTVLRPNPHLWVDPLRAGEFAHPAIWQQGALEPSRTSLDWVPPTEATAAEWFGVPNDWPRGAPFPN